MQLSESSENVDNLDNAQKCAVFSEASRLCILAPAGSGKTRVIVKRIEHLCKSTDLLPSQIVAITFTKKAGYELAKRLSKSFGEQTRERPQIGTLHSFALGELYRYSTENKTKMKSILEDQHSFAKSLKISNPTRTLRAISWCKTRLINPKDINEENIGTIRRHIHASHLAFDAKQLKKDYESYLFACRKKSLIDHDDVLLEYFHKLKDENYVNTRQFLYRHLFVDEFQDTTPLHMEIYKKLVGKNGCISVVGDPDQSIFSFAGASDVYLNYFEDFFPGSHTVFLNTN